MRKALAILDLLELLGGAPAEARRSYEATDAEADKVFRVRTSHCLEECPMEISSVAKTSGAEENSATIFVELELSKSS